LEAGHDRDVVVGAEVVVVALEGAEEVAEVVIVEFDPETAFLLRTNPQTALFVEAGLIAFFI